MKERPILFSGAMVRAILDGTKTQTRRIVKPQPSRLEWFEHQKGWIGSFGDDAGSAANPHRMVPCPYGQPGDRLIVKEDAWMWCGKLVSGLTKKTGKPKICWMQTRNTRPVFCADHPDQPEMVPENGTERIGDLCYMWRKKIARFVPRWACRVILEITAVRVERLHDITEEDANAEGMNQSTADAVMCPEELATFAAAHILAPDAMARITFETVWEKINGPGSWDANPWVWVVKFKRIRGER